MSFFKDNDKPSIKLTIQRTPTGGIQQEVHWTDYDTLHAQFEEYAQAHDFDIMNMLNLYQIIAYFCEPERVGRLQTITAVGKTLRITFEREDRTVYRDLPLELKPIGPIGLLDMSVGEPILLKHLRNERSHPWDIASFEHLHEAQDAVDLFLNDPQALLDQLRA